MPGLALAYSGNAIASTIAMATVSRARQFAILRLAGATTGQVLHVIVREAFLVTGIAGLLGAAVTAVTLAGLRRGLSRLAPVTRVAIPWTTITEFAVACLTIAVLSSVIPAAVTLRTTNRSGGHE